MSALDRALEYRERGFSLLPLASRSKEPHHELLRDVHADSSWTCLRDRACSVPEIREWFARDPEVNIGVITGPSSGGLVVVDFDTRRGHGVTHPATPTVATHRGHHVYLRSRDELRTQSYPWGEIRAGGDYVVAPPSIHAKGAAYEWVIGLDDEELADLSSVNIPPEGGEGAGVLRQEVPLPEYPSNDGEREELAHDPVAVQRACAVWNVTSRIGRKFRCVLPGHRENDPSAAIWCIPDGGIHKYHDMHHPEVPSWLTLAEVHASRAARSVVRLPGPSQSRWYSRLFYEAGCLTPVPVPLPQVPRGARPAAHKVALGFQLLLGLRWLRDDPGTPAAFASSLGAPWCGLSVRAFGEALRFLRREGVIAHVGTHPGTPHPMNLYLPGDGKPWRG